MQSNNNEEISRAFSAMRAQMDAEQRTTEELAMGKLGIERKLYYQASRDELERMRLELELRAANLAYLADPSTGSYPQWRVSLDGRERALVAAAESYARCHKDAGLPGHNLLMLVAKLSGKLDEAGR